jgi:small-conductance mechanosensitive channel
MDTDEAVDKAIDIGTHIGGAVLVLAIGYVFAVIARRYTHRILARPKIASALGPSTEQLLKSAVFYVILALAVAASLIALGVSGTTVTTVIVILIALIGLALQQSLANFAATVIFLMF